MKIPDNLQHRQQRAGTVWQGEGKQDHPGVAAAVSQIALAGEGLLHRLELRFLPFHVQEKHMGIHGLVVAHPVNVRSHPGNGADRAQKSARPVRQAGDKSFLHAKAPSTQKPFPGTEKGRWLPVLPGPFFT